MRAYRHLSITLILMLWIAYLPNVSAALIGENRKVLLAYTSEDSRGIEYRIRAELEALGFDVVLMTLRASDDPVDKMDMTARKEGVAAAVLWDVKNAFVEIWVADPITGRVIKRRLRFPVDMEASDSVISLGIAELLRSTFVEMNSPAHERKFDEDNIGEDNVFSSRHLEVSHELSPTESVIVTAPVMSLGLYASGSFLFLVKRIPPLSVCFGMEILWKRRFSVMLSGSVPVLFERISASPGDVVVKIGTLMMAMNYGLFPADGRVQLFVGAGWKWLLFQFRATPTPEYESHDSIRITSAPLLRMGLEIALSHRMRLRLDTAMGSMVSRINVVLNEPTVATYGHFFATTGIGLMIHL